MNIISLLAREEPIAGLEISDDCLRLAFLEPNKKTSGYIIKFLTEQKLEDGIISEGAVKDTSRFVEALKKLVAESNSGIRYIIASIPANRIYSKILYFPRMLEEKKIKESIRLAMSFQFPVSLDESYLDYYELPEQSPQNNEFRREIFLAAGPKAVIDDYILTFKSAGLNPVAIEPHYQSFLRTADLPAGETVLIRIDAKKSIGALIVKDGVLRFGRIVPKKFLTEEKTEEELRKISDFYETENETSVNKKIPLSEIKMIAGFEHPELKNQKSEWLTAVGAALRGAIPRSQDALLSLMPVGTEEAYDYQKAVVFSGFLSNIIIGLSVFFAAAFFGVWLLMVAIQQNLSSRIETFSLAPPSKESLEIENQARNFNELTKISREIIKIFPRHSVIFDELKPLVPSGIAITQASFSSGGKISLAGAARSRIELNSFKKKLEESGSFSDINMPLANLEMRENIPFSVAFQLKNQSLLYWQ